MSEGKLEDEECSRIPSKTTLFALVHQGGLSEIVNLNPNRHCLLRVIVTEVVLSTKREGGSS